MAKSLANFVVGIGADTSKFKDGMKEVNSSMHQVRSGALVAGTALASMLTAVAGIAVSTAKSINEMDLQIQYTDASIQFAYNFGNAVERMGGKAMTARAELVEMQKTLNAFQREGERGKLEQIAMLGIDPTGLFNLENDLEAFQRNLADIVSVADSKQKLGIQETLGLSDATMRLLEKGSLGVELEMKASESRTGEIESMVEDSRELREEWGKLKEHAKGFNNEVSKQAIPVLTDATKSASAGMVVGKEVFKKKKDPVETAIWSALAYGISFTSARNKRANYGRDDKESAEKLSSGDPFMERLLIGEDITNEGDSVDNSSLNNNSYQYDNSSLNNNSYQYDNSPVTNDVSNITNILQDETAPEVTHIQNNAITNNLTGGKTLKQPIQIQNNITTTVELDKRKVGETVENYLEEQYYLMEQGIVGTTLA